MNVFFLKNVEIRNNKEADNDKQLGTTSIQQALGKNTIKLSQANPVCWFGTNKVLVEQSVTFVPTRLLLTITTLETTAK